MIPTQYQKRRAKIQTGDVLLFSGKGRVSAAIKRFTRSKWSHVGMAWRSEELDTVLVFESTTLNNVVDVDTGELAEGVQLTMLSERLAHTDAHEVRVRHLTADWTPERLRQLSKFRREMHGRPYEKGLFELVKSAYDGPFGRNKPDLSSIFCSELLAEAYQQLGFMDRSVPANEFTPHDWSEKYLQLLGGAKLSKPYLLKHAS